MIDEPTLQMSLASLEPMEYSHWPHTISWSLAYEDTETDTESDSWFGGMAANHNSFQATHNPHTILWMQSEMLVFNQFKSTVGPAQQGGSPWGISASTSTRNRCLNPAWCWVPMTALQTVPIPLVAQHFSKMEKNCFGDLNPHGPASWV